MTKRNALLLFFTFLASGSALAADQAPVRVTLSIPVAKTYPGLSVPLLLHVENRTSALQLAPGVQVRATSPAGETFVLSWGERALAGELEFGVTDEETTDFVLPANSAVDLSVPAVDLITSSWAHDPRLVATPGLWTLVAILHDQRDGMPFVSSATQLEIMQPTPKDVWIWQALQKDDIWSVAEKMMTDQPDSVYFPYAATAVRRLSVLEKVGIINRAIALHPTSSVVPWLHYSNALYYGSEADSVFSKENNVEKAAALADKGRAELQLLRNSNQPWASLKANQKLCCEYPSRDYFVELQRLAREKGTRKPH